MIKRHRFRLSKRFAVCVMGVTGLFLGTTCFGQSSDSLTDQFDRQYQDGKYAEAEATARSGLSQAETTNESVPIAVWQHNLGMSLDAQGKYRDAVAQYDVSRRRLEQALGPDDLQVALSLNNLANTYSNLAEFAKSKALHEHRTADSGRKARQGPFTHGTMRARLGRRLSTPGGIRGGRKCVFRGLADN